MYNLIKYSDNYSKRSGSLQQYSRDDPNDNIVQSESLKSKVKITGNTPTDGNTKDVEILVPLKYLSNFWKTPEIPLINCEVELILTWSKDCVISSATGETKFTITEIKVYVPVITLSTEDNAKLLQQLKSNFRRKINWNKYESSVKTFAQNRYLNYLINPNFQGVNRLFVLSFENENDSFGVEHFPKEIIKFISSISLNENIITNIFRIQAYDSITCGYFYIRFITFMFKGKTLTELTNLFSPYDF